jgi:AcrR family transcriptional regulator
MPRAGLSTEAVVDAALTVIDDQGLAALSLAAVAAHTRVAAPSLYKHVGNLAELRMLVGARVMAQMTDRFSAAVIGHGDGNAVTVLMWEYRNYVLEYPARYAAMPADPLHDPALAAVGNKLFSVFLAVFRDYGLVDDAAIHAVRCLRVVVHGFASFESGGGFGLSADPDVTYLQLIRMFIASLPSPKA